ncbi:MAG TPA: protein kinase, partial [Polyangiaceae bacterium]|jgi:serine/threonine-protein kinase|nr:protein kinase [Polyangiaceae bacterium]
MGTVYKARDNELDVLVALKVLRRDLVDDPGMLMRFRREVKLARRVTHRNVARAHDIGEHEGDRFLTMELVEGESLRQVLEREPRLPVLRVLEIAFAVCEGLDAAHRVGVVHRDLKPDNVLMARDGRIVITDFGIARAVEPGVAALTVGTVFGTPGYMAPEQVEGSEAPDARADIFALGVILFELFTGQRPFGGQSPSIGLPPSPTIVATTSPATVQHESVPLPPAASFASPPDPVPLGAPAAAAPVILRCLERERNARFSSARELADALRAVPIEPSAASFDALRPPSSVRPRSVVVLPLRNAGPKEDDYLADGLTDDLIDLLSMTPGLRVRPRGAVMHLKGLTRDSRSLGSELGVDVVVEGSMRKANQTVQFAVRVISVADGFQLWAKRFDLEAGRVLSVTDEVAKAVAHALMTTPASPERATPANPEALDLYFRARHEYHGFELVAPYAPLPTLRAVVMNSVALFDKAHALAPDDPMILSGYVLAHARTWFFDADAAREHAFDSASRAVALAPTRGESYLARASVDFQRGDLAAAVEDARRALSLAPLLGDAHELLGRILCETGPADEGIHHMRAAVELEPGFRSAHATILRVQELLGNRAEADRLADEIVLGDEGGMGWSILARVMLWRKDEAGARTLFEHPVIQSRKAPSAREILRLVFQPDAVPSAGKLVAASLGTVGASWRMPVFLEQARAEFGAAKGKVNEAWAALAASVDAGLIDLLWIDACPILSPLREDARFAALRARVLERVELVRAALDAPDLASHT